MLNCRLGELPMKYLGIPVSDMVLCIGAFQGILNKMIKRLDPWKGNAGLCPSAFAPPSGERGIRTAVGAFRVPLRAKGSVRSSHMLSHDARAGS